MSVQSGMGKLSDALKDLTIVWSRIRPEWRDKVAEDFEKEFVEPMGPRIKRATQAMVSLAETLHRAKSECGP